MPLTLDPDRRLMRITGLDRDPDPRLNAMTDADLLDLLVRAKAVAAARGLATPPSTQGDEPLAAGWGR